MRPCSFLAHLVLPTRRGLLVLGLATACTRAAAPTLAPFHYNPCTYERVPLYYEVTGRGDTTLLFIHGWNLDHTYWQPQVDAFAAAYRVVTVDLAGCGASGTQRTNWTVESFARDLTRIIRRERLRNVVLVAHSMGGEIALDVAIANPKTVVGLVGVDNLKNVGQTGQPGDTTGIEAYGREFLAHYPSMAEAMAREFTKSADSAVVQRLVASYRRANPAIAVPTLLNVYPKALAAKYQLRRLHFPVQFIMSTATPYDEQAFRTYCPQGYRLILLDSVGHFPMVERPQVFNRALRQVLATPQSAGEAGK